MPGFSTFYPDSYPFAGQIPSHYSYKDKLSQSEIYSFGQGYRFTKFYLDFPDLLPFTHPTAFKLRSTYSAENRWLSLHVVERKGYNFRFDTIEGEIFDLVYNGPIEPDTKVELRAETAKKAIHCLYKYNIIRALTSIYKRWPDVEQVRKVVFENASTEGMFDNLERIDSLIELHQQIVERAGVAEGPFNPSYFKHRHERSREWRFYLIDYLYLPNNTVNLDLLKRLIELEERVLREYESSYIRITNYLPIPFLSAGEISFLTLFSRLYNVIQRYAAGSRETNNLILFIDEGEVGFHPAWKKSYLKWLLNFLKRIEAYTFQIILTTHSPYLLSDLASSNIILLKKEDGKTQIASSETFATFGANIHELLANSFFLKDGSIGAFAKEKIQWVIDKLNEWRESKKNNPALFSSNLNVHEGEQQKVFVIITQIGDLIVRNKLLEMYWHIFQGGTAIEDEIRYLQNRIQDLRNRQ